MPCDVFQAVASYAGKGRVDAQNLHVGIGDHHALLRFKSRGGDANFFFGQLLRGDVLRCAHTAQGSALGIKLNLGALADPADRIADHDTVLVDQRFAIECFFPVLIQFGQIVGMNARQIARTRSTSTFGNVKNPAGFGGHIDFVGRKVIHPTADVSD